MAVADLLPVLDDDDRFLALFHGIVAVANDCAGEPPRTETEPLGGNGPRAGSATGFACAIAPVRSALCEPRLSQVRHRSG
jgi:hypothetical protein